MAIRSSGIDTVELSSDSDLENPGLLPPEAPRSPQPGPSWAQSTTPDFRERHIETHDIGTITNQPGSVYLHKSTSTTDLVSGYHQVPARPSSAFTDFFNPPNIVESDDSDFELLDPRDVIPPTPTPTEAGDGFHYLLHRADGPNRPMSPSPSTQEGYTHDGIMEGNRWRENSTWLQRQQGVVDDPNMFPLVRTTQPQSMSLAEIVGREEDALDNPDLDQFVNNWMDNGDMPSNNHPVGQIPVTDQVTTNNDEDDDTASIYSGPCPSSCDSLKENQPPRVFLSPTPPHSPEESETEGDEDSWHDLNLNLED